MERPIPTWSIADLLSRGRRFAAAGNASLAPTDSQPTNASNRRCSSASETGTLQVFAVDKVSTGLARALAGSVVTADEMNVAVNEIEANIRTLGSDVTSDDIGQLVLAYLRQVDEAAYLRFASVHKDFRDASDFEREAATLDRSS